MIVELIKVGFMVAAGAVGASVGTCLGWRLGWPVSDQITWWVQLTGAQRALVEQRAKEAQALKEAEQAYQAKQEEKEEVWVQ